MVLTKIVSDGKMARDVVGFVAVRVGQGSVIVFDRAVVRPRGTGVRNGTAAASVAAGTMTGPGASKINDQAIDLIIINVWFDLV